MSRIAQRLDADLVGFRTRRLEQSYPYLYLDATYLKVHWGSHVGDVAVLVAVGVNLEDFREVPTVKPFGGGEKTKAYRSLLKGPVQRGLSGVSLVVSDDHDAIKKATVMELPGTMWQRCVVHFMRNVLAKVPWIEAGTVAADLKSVFAVNRGKDARALEDSFCCRWGSRFGQAVGVLRACLDTRRYRLRFRASSKQRALVQLELRMLLVRRGRHIKAENPEIPHFHCASGTQDHVALHDLTIHVL